MATVAVLVIDVQREFFCGPSASYRGDQVIAGINQLTSAARAARAPVFFVQHDGVPEEEQVVPGTEDWELHPALVRTDDDQLVRKSVGDSFHETSLADRLERLGVDRLLLCGYATEFCVDTTARRAVTLGYRTTVVSDLHTTQRRPHLAPEQIVAHHNWVWENASMSGNCVAVRPLSDVLATEFA
ncbi:cysteine hydrolase family protein [Paraburkholderia sp. GAS334]|uniref:cysteine hydrolase family protein n=1 Tax=Paraburkholderia sp. GAS334 TaxID=3035131 RepID=UPI003D1C829D